MLYHWIYPLSQELAYLNVFKYITFRAFIGFILAIVFSIVLGKYFIRYMKNKHFGQSIRDDGPKDHKRKSGTPTMGGVFIFTSIIATLLICGNFYSIPIMATMIVLISYFILGFCDDYLKIAKKNHKGISGKTKLIWQFTTALFVGIILVYSKSIDTNLYMPFIKTPIIDLGWFYVVFISFVIAGSSNAVNLTDGLDGLVVGPIVTSSISLGILAYVAGHAEIANYLYIPYIDQVGELSVLATAIVGASLGFLWYNSYPAQVFMGDVGSLSIGGVLGTIAVLTKNELLFILIGGIFVLEALSVIIQVISFKTRKKRVFKMSPIHHHFELLGWHESKVIVRFWIISIFLATLALATLKLR